MGLHPEVEVLGDPLLMSNQEIIEAIDVAYERKNFFALQSDRELARHWEDVVDFYNQAKAEKVRQEQL